MACYLAFVILLLAQKTSKKVAWALVFTWEGVEAHAEDKRRRFSKGTVFFYSGTVCTGDILWSSPMLERRVGWPRLPEGGDRDFSLFAPNAGTVRGTAHMSDRGWHAVETVPRPQSNYSLISPEVAKKVFGTPPGVGHRWNQAKDRIQTTYHCRMPKQPNGIHLI